jgi:alkanesulfonate monooxygenase SsuD/methylene tetrahydromethanopterin reductase-like flavin-dependent oxidoreductase (luciferase family)
MKLAVVVVVVPHRQPVLLARQLASLDVFSEGRLIVGVGVGQSSVEFC